LLEIYTGEQAVVYYTVRDSAGMIVEPDSAPVVNIFDADTDLLISTGASELIDDDNIGVYQYAIPSSVNNAERSIVISWEYELLSEEKVFAEHSYVVSPYVTVEEIISELELSDTPGDPRYYSEDQIRSAERGARMMINAFIGRKVSAHYGISTAYGTGADVLQYDEKINSFSRLIENDVVVIDIDNDINTFGYAIETTETGHGIRIVAPGENINESPVITIIGSTGSFKDGYRYELDGVFGWKYLPMEIKQAAFLLVNDFLCDDSTWTQKYVRKLNLGSMAISFSNSAYAGTGNFIADSLLSGFKSFGVVVI
jgi:GTPase SAR1 family protein